MSAVDEDLAEEGGNHAAPELPLDLPESRDGRKPSGMKTSLTGSGNRITTAHAIGDTVVLVIEAKVKSAGHDQTDDGLLYTEKYKVVDLWEVAAGRGHDLLVEQRLAYQDAQRRAGGEVSLFDDEPQGIDVVTDASGVAMTPTERAAVTGQTPAMEPILGYDRLTAKQVIEMVDALDSVDQLTLVGTYENLSRKRKAIVAAVEKRIGVLEDEPD
jgi:hypothetical protein